MNAIQKKTMPKGIPKVNEPFIDAAKLETFDVMDAPFAFEDATVLQVQLGRIRKAKGVTRAFMSEKTEYSKNVIMWFERGSMPQRNGGKEKPYTNIDLIEKYCKLLGLKIQYLVADKPVEQCPETP